MVALDLNQIIQKLVDITKEYGALFQVCVCGWMNGWACICFCGCGCVRVYVLYLVCTTTDNCVFVPGILHIHMICGGHCIVLQGCAAQCSVVHCVAVCCGVCVGPLCCSVVRSVCCSM